MGDLPDMINDVVHRLSPINGSPFATSPGAGCVRNGGFFWYTDANSYCCFGNWLSPGVVVGWYGQPMQIFRMMIKQVN